MGREPGRLPGRPRTGVIYVTSEAYKLGYRSADPSWCNLGQGQPDTGHPARRRAGRGW